MTQVRINLNETEEKIVGVLKGIKNYTSKESAIKDIIKEYGEQEGIVDLIKKVGGNGQ
jgi:hypothetical protein